MENQYVYSVEEMEYMCQMEEYQKMQYFEQLKLQQQQELEMLQHQQEMELSQQQQQQFQYIQHCEIIAYQQQQQIINMNQQALAQEMIRNRLIIEKKAYDLKHKFVVYFIHNRIFSPQHFHPKNYIFVQKLRKYICSYIINPTEENLNEICDVSYYLARYMKKFVYAQFNLTDKVVFCSFLRNVLVDKLNKKKVLFNEILLRSYDIFIEDSINKLLAESKKK